MKKVKIKNEVLFTLDALLASYGQIKDVKLGWCFARNRSFIKPVLDDFRKQTEPTKEILEYEKGKMELFKTHGIMKPDGTLVQTPVPGEPGVSRIAIKDKAAFDADLAEMNKDHEKALADVEEIREKKIELYDIESEVTTYQIDVNALPKDVLSQDDMFFLGDLGIIHEEGVEVPKPTPLKAVKDQKKKPAKKTASK